MLIINADDYGMTSPVTDRCIECHKQKLITSASLMVFMGDTDRAVEIAKSAELELGLHINLTLPFEMIKAPLRLKKEQISIVNYLTRRKWSRLIYNPFMRRSFDYVFKAQYEEYYRLLKSAPNHINGHHHMHLCLNMIFGNIIPEGTYVRRSYSFDKCEKRVVKRIYRRVIDSWLLTRYICSDRFYGIEPISDLKRIEGIVNIAKAYNVEMMVHPGDISQFNYMRGPHYRKLIELSTLGTCKTVLQLSRSR